MKEAQSLQDRALKLNSALDVSFLKKKHNSGKHDVLHEEAHEGNTDPAVCIKQTVTFN